MDERDTPALDINEPDSFTGKAFRGEAVVHYREPLITQQMGESGDDKLGLICFGVV